LISGKLIFSGTGREISGIFVELPDRKDLPDYYKVIANPVSLSDIEVSHIRRGVADGPESNVVAQIRNLGGILCRCGPHVLECFHIQ
jgi:hypothetical protein